MAIDGDDVLLRYQDYQDNNQWKTKRMDGVEFIRRFLTHLLPPYMVHIRRYGFMGSQVHCQRISQIRKLLGAPELEPDDEAAANDEDDEEPQAIADEPTKRCRGCGGKMHLTDYTPRPTVAEILWMPLCVFQNAKARAAVKPGAKRTFDIESGMKEKRRTAGSQASGRPPPTCDVR